MTTNDNTTELRPCHQCGGDVEKWCDTISVEIRCKPCYYANSIESHNAMFCWKEIDSYRSQVSHLMQLLAQERDAFGKKEIELMRERDAYREAAPIIWRKHGLTFTWDLKELDAEAQRIMKEMEKKCN